MKQMILAEARRLRLGLQEFEIDRCHRMFDSYEIDGWRYQPTIIRFTSWSARDTFYQARKQFKWSISAHLTPRREQILHEAKALIEHPLLKGSIQYFFVDKNCRF